MTKKRQRQKNQVEVLRQSWKMAKNSIQISLSNSTTSSGDFCPSPVVFSSIFVRIDNLSSLGAVLSIRETLSSSLELSFAICDSSFCWCICLSDWNCSLYTWVFDLKIQPRLNFSLWFFPFQSCAGPFNLVHCFDLIPWFILSSLWFFLESFDHSLRSLWFSLSKHCVGSIFSNIVPLVFVDLYHDLFIQSSKHLVISEFILIPPMCDCFFVLFCFVCWFY